MGTRTIRLPTAPGRPLAVVLTHNGPCVAFMPDGTERTFSFEGQMLQAFGLTAAQLRSWATDTEDAFAAGWSPSTGMKKP
jgi:hypothetical protein